MSSDTVTAIEVPGLTITTAIADLLREPLAGLTVGEELELVTERFPAIVPDLEAWGRFAGHEVVDVIADGDVQRIRLRRTVPTDRPTWRVAVVVSADGLEELLSPLGFALAAAHEGAAVAVYFQGPGVHVLREGFTPRMRGISRPISRFARAGMARSGHVAAIEKVRQLQALGARIYACGPSLQRFKVPVGRLAVPDVTVCEYLTFMEVMAAADVQLYP